MCIYVKKIKMHLLFYAFAILLSVFLRKTHITALQKQSCKILMKISPSL